MSRSRSALPTVAFLAGFTLLAGCAAGAASPATSPASSTSPSTATIMEATIIDANPSFPAADAQTALSAVRPVLRSCRRDTHATPVVFDATVEFDATGKVSKAAVAPSGPVSDCVRAELTQLEIPKFDGAPVEVQLQVTL